MGIINLEDVQVNMVLAKDIKDRSGRILLSEGSKITEKHMKVFKMWGITEADIRDIEKDDITANIVSQLDPRLLHDVEAQTLEHFRNADMEHPFFKELFRLLIIRLVKNKQRGPAY